MANNVPYDQILKIPYEGGNGGAYPATPAESIGYGLTIARLAGTLVMGQGEVAYRISGTPTSLPTNNIVSFPLTFLDETCTVTIGEDTEIKTMKFVRKSIPLIGSTLPTASEITFGNVTFRFAYRAAGTGVTEACRPEFKPVFNTRMLYWFRKAGSGGGMYTRYGQINASSDNWYTYADGDHTSAFAPTSQTANEYISAENRDFAEAIIMLQNDDFREMYRVTYNVYNGTNTVPVTTAACTIFIEKLD